MWVFYVLIFVGLVYLAPFVMWGAVFGGVWAIEKISNVITELLKPFVSQKREMKDDVQTIKTVGCGKHKQRNQLPAVVESIGGVALALLGVCLFVVYPNMGGPILLAVIIALVVSYKLVHNSKDDDNETGDK